jgi:hypothetical protein
MTNYQAAVVRKLCGVSTTFPSNPFASFAAGAGLVAARFCISYPFVAVGGESSGGLCC